MRLAALLCVVGLAAACADGGRLLPTHPSTVASPVPPISVGEEVKDTLTFNGEYRVFELTAPSDGTLVVHVSWEPSRGVLELQLADRVFPAGPEGSIVGRLPVLAGQQYRILVADGAPWDYGGLSLPFVLTASIE